MATISFTGVPTTAFPYQDATPTWVNPFAGVGIVSTAISPSSTLSSLTVGGVPAGAQVGFNQGTSNTITEAGFNFTVTLVGGIATILQTSGFGAAPRGDWAQALDALQIDATSADSIANGTYSLTIGGTASTPGDTVTSSNESLAVTCFAAGTRIRTEHGEVAVEELRIGDLAVTAGGVLRPIRWLGNRSIDCRRHPEPETAFPVRISAHALGPDKPARDLLVSPGHGICIDVAGEVLIPADALLNGATIVQEEVGVVTYWHVELDTHDILLAENLPAESYIDTGNRNFFAESDFVDLFASPDKKTTVHTHADFCRPFHENGALVEVVRAQVRLRAERLGWRRVTPSAFEDAYLEVDGQVVRPEVRDLVARFRLPATARNVWLVGPTLVPQIVADVADCRSLALCVSGITVEDGCGASRVVALDDARLKEGFHRLESEPDGRCWRWTGARARLPSSLWAGLVDTVTLQIDLGSAPTLHRWTPPDRHLADSTLTAA